ncbi:hypothetical protein LGH70_02855 [Hymenobacter sp. BT635]|uniref:DUF4251 domain-containing protein n=1 Tax=Hymenobacter nitidus TaxID=2880929 RepID=A0ABS8A7Y3_9BACT|nr:hypothetical protein [Hymenobacter nitidus]MCB2376503.1 hypothetical protein [Hymenobacter nitidus]
MKTFLFAGLLVGSTVTVSQAQTAAAEQQALMQQLDQLMQDPKKPKQDVHLALRGCHAEQIIRDRGAEVQMSKPLAMSYGGGDSGGWAMRMADGFFELKMSFDWADVQALTYAPATNDDGQQHYQIKISKSRKGSNITFELPLYTSSEATVKDVVRRLEKLRNSCRE